MKKTGLIISILGVFTLLALLRDDMKPLINRTELSFVWMAVLLIAPGLILLVADKYNPIRAPLPFCTMTLTVLGLFGSVMSSIFYQFGQVAGVWPEILGIHGILIFAFVSREKNADCDIRTMLSKKADQD